MMSFAGPTGQDQALGGTDETVLRARPARTPQKRAALLDAVSKGLPDTQACALAGISRTTLWRWMLDDPEFKAEVLQARASRTAALLDAINDAASKDWRAAAWLLARLNPLEFSDRAQVDPADIQAELLKLLGLDQEPEAAAQ